ncbi:hypothetical protein C8Q74DRAFT_1254182 [Fomes fomentarius]|nr:hypothetical protein C8Q74DRAFT_1254182 [Fomes fomentarius]
MSKLLYGYLSCTLLLPLLSFDLTYSQASTATSRPGGAHTWLYTCYAVPLALHNDLDDGIPHIAVPSYCPMSLDLGGLGAL